VLAGCSTGGGASSASTSSINLNAKPPTPPSDVSTFQPIAKDSGQGLKIGFIQLSLASAFPAALQKGMEDAAKQAGVTLLTCDSKFDTPTALACAQQFKTQGVQGQITFQGDAAASKSICDAGAQVPVVAIDINQACQKTFVGAANSYAGELGGYYAGKYFADNFKCQYDAYISLESTAVGVVNDQRMNGYKTGFESVCGKIHDEKVLDTGAGGQADVAQKQVTDTLTALPGAKHIVVVGINEDVILGALAAARSQNRTNDLYLSVQNLDPTNCPILTAPHWIGSVAYFPEKYPLLILPALIKLIKGETVPDKILVPHVFIDSKTIKKYYPEYACK
jgi:ribose transport system substrate-binding protein